MAPRSVSPLISEGGYDISSALVDFGDDSFGEPKVSPNTGIRAAASTTTSGLDLASGSDDDEDFIALQQANSNRKNAEAKAQGKKRSGGFQSMGFGPNLLKSIQRKGFSVPTPIQRKVIPLILDNQDVVGMARTGSGKTAAFVIPMLERLKAHSVQVGARAIILSPSRELALQTLKTVKEFGRGTDLRTVLLVGGDRLEDQFSQMASNPDIIIATPGRFMHLMVEMNLDVSSAKYVVFDEADRLFEMGFAMQLNEILHALPAVRQTLLFSATLPASLVEFAKAGLREPNLVRLDAESKMSPDLQSAFLTVKSSEKEGALLHLLQDVIGMPSDTTTANQVDKDSTEPRGKKRRRNHTTSASSDLPTPFSTIIFAATKHHVEYLAAMLRDCGFAVSYVYGSLDQTARLIEVENFRSGSTSILVVTDVAARGIDIPMLANVINYNFPPQPKVFVHRVGRTARAGRTGWSYSLIQEADVPYLLDLQLFLGNEFVLGRQQTGRVDFADKLVVGAVSRSKLDDSCEQVSKLLGDNDDLELLRQVSVKGEKMYTRTKKSASSESAKRAKLFTSNPAFGEPNLLYRGEDNDVEAERSQMLAKISGFRPAETVFEIGRRNDAGNVAEGMRKKKQTIQAQRMARKDVDMPDAPLSVEDHAPHQEEELNLDISEQESDDFELTVSDNPTKASRSTWQDAEHFMSYAPKSLNIAEEDGYGVHSGSNNTSNFTDAARGATMDLGADESKSFAEPSRMRWDKRSKKYVSTRTEDSKKGGKTIRGESGQQIAASFRSGRFDDWRKANRVGKMPKVGEKEAAQTRFPSQNKSTMFKHRRQLQPKQPDKYRDDYHKKQKRIGEAKAESNASLSTNIHRKGHAQGELKNVDDVRKARNVKLKRREKNARPLRKKKT